MKPRVCIITFATVQDRRLYRQAEYITPHFDVTAVCYAEIARPIPNVEWRFIDQSVTLWDKAADRALLIGGKALPHLYDAWFWRRKRYHHALRHAVDSKADIFQANDWAALAVAVEAAKRTGKIAVYDAHEYWRLESENDPAWRRFFSPLIQHIERRYLPQAAAVITVCAPIAERYSADYGVSVEIIMNAPAAVPLPPNRPLDPRRIRLIHHGSAVRDRILERMIETLALTDARFTLDFMLLEVDAGYIDDLRRLSERIAPGRVGFLPAIPAEQVIPTIAQYDMGIYILPQRSYNYYMALPNRFFDFIAAGLAVCIGPSPAMRALVEQHGFGVVAPSFEAADAAAALNALTAEQIEQMRQRARQAAALYTAERENHKFVALFQRLLS
jgi:glycosyltransferase involved in cell wall biosynthesis